MFAGTVSGQRIRHKLNEDLQKGAERVSVVDDGAGVAPHDLPKLFERNFCRTRALGGSYCTRPRPSDHARRLQTPRLQPDFPARAAFCVRVMTAGRDRVAHGTSRGLILCCRLVPRQPFNCHGGGLGCRAFDDATQLLVR
jgi:hypothetical protein